VFIIGIILEGVADLRRRANDNKFNHHKINIVHKNESNTFIEKEIKAEELKVGHIVKMLSGTKVMADCIVIETDDSLGQCYINTA
jgi:magnesium-transporting ATPase (P-type)